MVQILLFYKSLDIELLFVYLQLINKQDVNFIGKILKNFNLIKYYLKFNKNY